MEKIQSGLGVEDRKLDNIKLKSLLGFPLETPKLFRILATLNNSGEF